MSGAQATSGSGHIVVNDFGIGFGHGAQMVEAVSNLSLQVQPGEFVSLIGPSGCGKSTVLNALAGFIKPSRGSVVVDGAAINGPGADRGMVFQQYSLFPWKTVRENVEFGLKMQGIGATERREAARTLLGLAGVLAFEDHYPDQLSGGMKQRVGIVRALATQPRVLLLDEPFGALDAQTRAIMQTILLNLWEGCKISVLFVTHDIDEAIYLSDRIYVMTARPGRIKAEMVVGLERPRDPEVTADPKFLALRRELMALIREESLRAMGNEISPSPPQSASRMARDIADAVRPTVSSEP
jgi:NitT/TauT family transport system ATP-binding protein